MGEVFLADDTQLGRKVAIKFLTEALEADPKALERLYREARSAAALDHPYICKVFEIVEIDGRTGIVMEHVHGETLQARMRQSRLRVADALAIAGEIAEALDEAHTRLVVHRDLKPSNVMLAESGHVKVMDFGLAKPMAAADGPSEQEETVGPITESGVRIGTPAYMSPEQLLGGEADARSDIFAFGVLLYELFAGVHPFTRSNPTTTMAAVLRDTPAPIGTHAPQASTGVQVAIDRLLAKEPDQRYQSFSDVRTDLSRLADETSSLTPAPGAGGSLSSGRTPYVGREAEQAELARLLDDAIAGRGGLVFIGGEPGVGKTRIAGELLRQARHRGCLAQTGHCYEMEGTPPFIPFVEMIERTARIVPKAAFREALGDAAPEVARLVPELRQLFPDLPRPAELPPDQQRRYLFNNFLRFIERASRATPHALLLDDLHWADESTLQLLQHIAPHLAQMPMLVVGTYRDVDLDAERPFARTLEALTRQRLAQKIALKRLDRALVGDLLAALAGQPAPGPLVRAVFRETEGNPFFVEEVYHHLAEEGKLFDGEGRWRADLRVEDLDVPEGIKLVIGRRIQRLSPESRQLLTMAAVVGRSFDLQLLSALGSEEDAVLTALEDAEAAQLIRAVATGRVLRWEFAHGLIRQTLEGALSLPRRQRAHLRVAEAMERVYGERVERQAAGLAHHLYQAGAAADPEKAVRFLTLAGDQAAASGAFDEAVRLFDDALSTLDEDDPCRRADLQTRRGQALRAIDRYDEAIEAFQTALDDLERLGDAAGLAEAGEALATTLVWLARLPEARDVVDRVLPLQPNDATENRCRLLLVSGVVTSSQGEPAGLRQLAEAQVLAEASGDPRLVATAVASAAAAGFHWMLVREDVEAAHPSLPAARESGDPWDPWFLADLLWTTGFLRWMAGRLDEAQRLLDELDPLANRLGHSYAAAVGGLVRMMIDFTRYGDIEATATWATGAGERMEAAGLVVVTSLSHRLLAAARFYGGDWTAAETSLRHAMEIDLIPSMRGISDGQLAVLLACVGEPTAVDLLESLALPSAGRPNTGGRWAALSGAVQAGVELGRLDEVAALYPLTLEALETGAVIGRDFSMWEAVAGMAAAAGEQWETANTHFQTALRQAEVIPNKIGQPEVRRAWARMLIQRGGPGDKDQARTLLDKAIELYDELGMPKHLEMAMQMLNP